MSDARGIDLTTMFMSRLQTPSYIISSYYTTGTVLMVAAFAVTALTGEYAAMLIMVPAVWMLLLAEVNVQRMHAMTLDYLRACGIDVSDAPKPIFPFLQRWVTRA